MKQEEREALAEILFDICDEIGYLGREEVCSDVTPIVSKLVKLFPIEASHIGYRNAQKQKNSVAEKNQGE